jgi:ABC-2 type transport system permease protein
MNLIRLWTLTKKETHRFLKVWSQTVLSPVMIAIMYFAVFGAALSSRISEFSGVPYLSYIVPGLALLQATSNAFQNPSSSIIIAKYQGIYPDLLIAPLSALEKTLGYLLGGVIRGMMVAFLIFGVAAFFADGLWPQNWGVLLLMLFLANGVFALLGTLAGMSAKTFDSVAAFTTFIVMPMGFLGGVFYSVHILPPLAYKLSLLNPFFYFVDATRWAFFGVSDIAPQISLLICAVIFAALFVFNYLAFAFDWRQKN